jgi:hypothetical protein
MKWEGHIKLTGVHLLLSSSYHRLKFYGSGLELDGLAEIGADTRKAYRTSTRLAPYSICFLYYGSICLG